MQTYYAVVLFCLVSRQGDDGIDAAGESGKGRLSIGGMDHSSYLLEQLLICELNQAKNGCSSLRAVIDSGVRAVPFGGDSPFLAFPETVGPSGRKALSPLGARDYLDGPFSIKRNSYWVTVQHTLPELDPNRAST